MVWLSFGTTFLLPLFHKGCIGQCCQQILPPKPWISAGRPELRRASWLLHWFMPFLSASWTAMCWSFCGCAVLSPLSDEMCKKLTILFNHQHLFKKCSRKKTSHRFAEQLDSCPLATSHVTSDEFTALHFINGLQNKGGWIAAGATLRRWKNWKLWFASAWQISTTFT